MTLGIWQLVMFASKNRQVVQIRIRVSHVEAVVYKGSLGFCDIPLRPIVREVLKISIREISLKYICEMTPTSLRGHLLNPVWCS